MITPRALSFLLLLLPFAAARADVVQLNSGEVVEGKIIASDAASITVEVQFSPTITEQRVIARSAIAGSSRATPDEAAFNQLRDLAAPATALDAKPYREFLDAKLRPFLKKFPTSPRAADVKALIKSTEADLARLEAGDVKVAGVWYDADAFKAEKYQIEAVGALEEMKRQIAAQNLPGAMNSFDLLQRSFPNSTAYAEAIPLAETAIKKLAQQLNFTLANLPQTTAQRQAAIDRTPPEKRAPIQSAVDAEDARAAALATAAQRANQRFFVILPYDEKGLKAMQSALKQVGEQFDRTDRKKLAAGARLVQQIYRELDANELPAATATLAQLRSEWPAYEGISRLEQRLRAAESDDAASTAREAERAAQPTPTPKS